MIKESPVCYVIEKYYKEGLIPKASLYNCISAEGIEMEEERMKQFAILCVKKAVGDSLSQEEVGKMIEEKYEQIFG